MQILSFLAKIFLSGVYEHLNMKSNASKSKQEAFTIAA